MSLSFALFAALMAATALAFVLWPLLRRQARGTPVALAIALAFGLPVTALALYAWVGTPGALDPANVTAQAPTQLNLDQAVVNLEASLAKKPDDVEGWLLLGRARQAMQQTGKSTQAYARALQLAPDNADVLIAVAEASSLDKPDHEIGAQAYQQLQKAVKIDPNNQRGLWLYGIADFQQGNYAQAAKTWETLLSLIDTQANPKVAAAVQQQIARARAAAGDSGPATDGSSPKPSATSDQGAAIRLHVSISPEMLARTSPTDAVFVYARATNSPPMPVAVKRLSVADLPADVTLSDAMSMTPQTKLSTFAEVEVGARVSLSGTATPHTGDPQAELARLAVHDAHVTEVLIDHVRP